LARTILPLAADVHVAVRRQAREALLGHEQLLIEFDSLEARAERSSSPPRASAFGERLASDLIAYLTREPTGLRVVTSVGSFTIAFAGVEAPINQASLVALAGAGFYDGLSFHRVVPGFVVQGGDPRGDGYGGPGFVVPCEWSNLRYERGTVGIALAGKDTGGSQFFVTQTPQPHLDARYTVVGQISEGLEVVDLLLPGDHIESVQVIYADGGE
jgi:cyclophilin family peptidyl-prolyl cis-trans isomerase